MAFSFAELDLTNVNVSSGASMLTPGNYVVKITDARVIKTNDKKGDRLEVKFLDTKGGGGITHWLNLNLPNSAKATLIGREQLKSMLYYGGHPNYNKPSDVNSFKGLVVGIHVVGTKYDGKDTVEVKYVCDPAKFDPINYTPKPELPKVDDGSILKAVSGDDIPF